MSEIDDATQRTAVAVSEIRQMLTNAGLQYSDAGSFVMGAGVGVAWSEDFYAVLSVANFLDEQLNITYGVLREVERDRLNVLDYCNAHNQSMTVYPVYLHDADNGWDILLQNVLPMQIVRDVPEFVVGHYLHGSSDIVDELRQKAGERGIGGEPYRWNTDDIHRLLTKSIL